MKKRIFSTLLLTSLMLLAALQVSMLTTSTDAAMPSSPTLDPTSIPKFVSQLVIPPVFVPTIVMSGGTVVRNDYKVDVTEFYQQILPLGYPMTKVWGYGGTAKDPLTEKSLGYFRNAPGATFEAIRGIPIQVTWQNKLTSSNMFPVDPTLHWANPNNMSMPTSPFPLYPPGFPEAQSPVPIVPHLHGGEDQSTSDGGPEAWFTSTGVHGPAYNTVENTSADSAVDYYPNMQEPTTLWYHDHALGITRLNVMSGLAGFYLLRDPADSVAPSLPSGAFEVPVVIQDRSFNLDGSFWFPSVGDNPDVHPYWQPEFFGNTIMVNGVVWPNFNVAQGQYRLRLLDGSNARFYTLSFFNKGSGRYLPFTQIGSDGGYLKTGVTMTALTIAPGERADVLINFAGLQAGTKILLKNTSKAPVPSGAPADPRTVGQIMQFTVTTTSGPAAAALPSILNPTLAGTFPTLPAPTNTRTLTLFEVEGSAGPEMVTLDGQSYDNPISEQPRVGSTEDWMIVDPTADAHPIHIHLVQFQVVSRQSFEVNRYTTDWIKLNGEPPLDHPTQNLQVSNYLVGKARGPDPNEVGWKDTVKVYPGEVTILRIRFAPQNAPSTGPNAPFAGVNLYPFDPTVGPGYVWHCHILDHEDNEMMRPYKVTG